MHLPFSFLSVCNGKLGLPILCDPFFESLLFLKGGWTFSKLAKRGQIHFFLIRGGIGKRGGML